MMRVLVSEALVEAEGVDKEFLAFLTPWLRIDFLQAPSVYVLCFSQSQNDLSQWRGYTPHGKGVCLGFDAGLLVRRMQKLGWQFQAVRYERESQLAYANAILTRMRREARAEHAGDRRFAHFDLVVQRALRELLQVAAMIKHGSFHHEKEVRFMSPPIISGDERISFRPARTALVPYIEFELTDDEPLEIGDIWIGPSPSDSLTQAAVLSLTKQLRVHINPKRIMLSNIPYREL
jgi:hypothetical protein